MSLPGYDALSQEQQIVLNSFIAHYHLMREKKLLTRPRQITELPQGGE